MQTEYYFAPSNPSHLKFVNSVSFSFKRPVSYMRSRGLTYIVASLDTTHVYCFSLKYAFYQTLQMALFSIPITLPKYKYAPYINALRT